MQVLVLYHSRSGHTEQLAREIAVGAESIEGAEVTVRSVEEVTRDEFVESAAIIAGSPVYFGSMSAELKAVFDKFVGARKRMANKIGAAFATSGDPTGGKETTLLSILEALLIYGMIVVGDPLEATGHYGVACVGAPNEDTIENARKHGARVAELALKTQS